MTDPRDASRPSPSCSPAAAPAPQWQIPWSSSSPPSPIELWHVARGAAEARTALEEEEEEEEEGSWVEEGREEGEGAEEDEGASQAFDPTLSCPASLHRDDDNEEEGSRWSPDELFSVRHRSAEELGEGEEGGGGGEGDGGRGRSSPSGASRPRRNRRRSSLSRSRSLLGEEPSNGERLEDLIDSMLAMTVRRMRLGERERKAKPRRNLCSQKKRKVFWRPG